MLLTKVTLSNYGVYRDKNEFDFRCDLEKPVILCGGANGAGKTTLLNPFYFAYTESRFLIKK